MKTKLDLANEEKERALHRQLIELTGSAEDIMHLRGEQEKEARVELLRRQSMRRVMSQGLANGYRAWVEFWEAKTYAMGRLRVVGNHLRSPELSHAFMFWAADSKDVKHKKEMEEVHTLVSIPRTLVERSVLLLSLLPLLVAAVCLCCCCLCCCLPSLLPTRKSTNSRLRSSRR